MEFTRNNQSSYGFRKVWTQIKYVANKSTYLLNRSSYFPFSYQMYIFVHVCQPISYELHLSSCTASRAAAYVLDTNVHFDKRKYTKGNSAGARTLISTFSCRSTCTLVFFFFFLIGRGGKRAVSYSDVYFHSCGWITSPLREKWVW